MSTVLCADIGTSSLKAALITGTGESVAFSRRMFLRHYTAHAALEWLPALRDAAAELAAQQQNGSINTVDEIAAGDTIDAGDEVAAICISGNGPTLVAEDGTTLLWNAPVPAAGNETSTQTALPPEAAHSLYIPRLLAFKRMFPAAWEHSPRILSGPEHLIWQLCGGTHTSALTILPEARYAAAYWSSAALAAAGIPEAGAKLAPFAAPAARAGELCREAAGLLQSGGLQIPQGTPVYCGAPDFISALAGTNTLHPGAVCDRAGSSEGLNLCTANPVSMNGIRTLPSPVAPYWNASFLLPESGTRFSAVKQKAERLCGRQLEFAAFVRSCMESGGSGTVFAEGWRLMQEIAAQIKEGMRALSAAAAASGTPAPHSATVTGGQAANDAWNQMKADVTGMDIVVPACRDAELLGDAVFAFCGMGIFSSVSEGAARLFRAAKTFRAGKAPCVHSPAEAPAGSGA